MGKPEVKNLVLGFDPGGSGKSGSKGNFGWSICSEVNGLLQERLKTGLAFDAWDAIKKVKDAVAYFGDQGYSCVRAAGIDAPLLWNKRGDNNGRRGADYVLIEALEQALFPKPAMNTVLAVNSLRGADVVQGLLLVRHLSTTWDIVITESHPTALEYLVHHIGQPQTVQMVQAVTAGLVPTDKKDPLNHKKDATLSAVSAWAALQTPPQWQNIYDGDLGLINPSQIPVGYWMPIP